MNKYSQKNEEELLKNIFDKIGVTNKYCVEFGCGDGYSNSNTRHLLEQEWNGLMMDGFFEWDSKENRHKEYITAENICELFDKYKVPEEFDLLSIDLDGNDVMILSALLEKYKPRVIVAEFNPAIPPYQNRIIEYDPNHIWGNDEYYGGSMAAFVVLGDEHGYTVINNNGLNLFMLRNDIEWDLPINDTYTERHDHAPSNRTNWVQYKPK